MPIGPSHGRTSSESEQNVSNELEKNVTLSVELPSLEIFQSELKEEIFFFHFGKSKNP